MSHISILDLPVTIDWNGHGNFSVVSQYVEERNQIFYEPELCQFTLRWRPLWALTAIHFKELSKPQWELYLQTYDAVETLQRINTLRATKECCDCAALELWAPALLVRASLVSHKFKIPYDIALIQLTGGYKNLDEM
jgi:hypothetical protein